MRLPKLWRAAPAILAGLVAVAALTQAGCLHTQPGNADERKEGARAPAGQRPGAAEPAESGELQQPLLRELGKAVDDAKDVEDSDRNEAWKILKEADPILTQIKEENRKAIEAANQPPRLQPQRSKKPKPSEEAPEPEGEKEPEA